MKAGWSTKRLGELCELISGQHIEAKDYNSEARGIGYLTGPSDFGPTNPIISKWTEHPKIRAQSGDILITVKGSGVGKINLLDQDDVAISRQLMAVRVFGANPLYIHAFLSSTFDHFQSLSTGAAIPGISREQVLGLKIATPTFAEQQRIVGILDEAFGGIATAKANAEKNLQNARALFDSQLRSVFSVFWNECELVPLTDLTSDITDGDHMPPPKAALGVPFITIGNINKNTRIIDFSDTFIVSEEYYNRLKLNRKPQLGDVLYTVTGSFGIPVIVNENRRFCFQRHIALIRPNQRTVSDWLYYLLLSPQVLQLATKGATGTAQKTVSLKVLRNLTVPKVPPHQQRVAVKLLDELFENTQRLESIYQQKLTALDELKKSLLHQAFSGHL